GRLDLAELDPKAANLDLVVDPTEKLDGAVAAIAGQVTRPVDAGAWRRVERVRDESLVGEVGTSAVAAGEPIATDPQLAGDANWDRSHQRVQDVEGGIGDRTTDRQGFALSDDPRARGPDGRLRRAVHVPEL